MPVVLVVDDEPNLLKLVQGVLERAGFSVLPAYSRLEALALFEAHQVDILLTDIVMPDRGGVELIQRLRQRRPGLPICGMSAHVPGAHADPFLQEVHMVWKPFAPRQLVETLQQALGTQAAEPGLSTLHKLAQDARDEWMDAICKRDVIIAKVPSGIPSPDGVLLVERAGLKRAVAFKRYKTAMETYTDALRRAGDDGLPVQIENRWYPEPPAPLILVVEREQGIRTTFRRTLEEIGYFVHESSDSRDAIRAIVKKRFDLLILDLDMRDMEAIRVVRTAHQELPAIKTVVAHAVPQETVSRVGKMLLGAADAAMAKPVAPDQLLKVVWAVLSVNYRQGILQQPGFAPVR